MCDEQEPQRNEAPRSDDAADLNRPESQQIVHSHVSAIVPERNARGVFSTGAVVVQGPHEFVIDFLMRMTSPQLVTARIVLPAAVVERLIAALRENIAIYESKFGSIAAPTATEPSSQKTSVEDLYEQLKIREDVLSGIYANAVMIGHSASEFSLDFITTFYPRSAVSCRIFLAAPNVPPLLNSLSHAFQQFQRRRVDREVQQDARHKPPGSADETGVCD